MPMMSIEAVRKAERLIQERQRIAAAKWNSVVCNPNLEPTKNPFGSMSGGELQLRDQAPADEQLQWAIEEFRKRKLDAIDAELRELGVDPTAQDEAAD